MLLSPAPGGAQIAGKVLAGLITTFGLGALVLGLGDALGYTRPVGVYWASTLGIVALFGAGLCVALGAFFQPISGAARLVASLRYAGCIINPVRLPV